MASRRPWNPGELYSGPKQKLPQRLTREEAAALIAQPNTRAPSGVRDRALIRLYYRAGLRVNEGLHLKVRDVDLRRHEIRVWQGKGGRDRRVWIDQTTAEYLSRWRDIRPRSDWFFCTLQGGRMSDRHVQAMIARRGKKAGIDIRCHPHLLRHTFATELLEDGYSIIEVQKLLGHAQLSTTAIYLHVADENLRKRLVTRTD